MSAPLDAAYRAALEATEPDGQAISEHELIAIAVKAAEPVIRTERDEQLRDLVTCWQTYAHMEVTKRGAECFEVAAKELSRVLDGGTDD